MRRVLRTVGPVFSAMLALWVVTTAHAVEQFKVSQYGGGHQIWFEAEAFDERNPATDEFFQVTGEGAAPAAPAGAFGQAITRAGGAGGMIRWDFDISKAGGTAGTWTFWARVFNPNNQSDYMLVEGDPDDEIPTGPPFPGDNGTPPFVNDDDRVFEETFTDWGWWGNGSEGSVKELHDGLNTMYIFHRQGNNTGFWDVFVWADDPAYQPSDDDYTNATPMTPTAVEPAGKLVTVWANLKSR